MNLTVVINQLFHLPHLKLQVKGQFSFEKLFNNFFHFRVVTLRNEKKLEAVNKDSQEEHPKNNLSRDTIVLRVSVDYFTQISEQIKKRVTKKLSQEFSRTESNFRISVEIEGASSEFTSPGAICNRFANFPEL